MKVTKTNAQGKVLLHLPEEYEEENLLNSWIHASTKEEKVLLRIAGIKGRYEHLKIDWSPEIEQEALERETGGITVYLERISEAQEIARTRELTQARQTYPEWGTW